ncbi:MAG TPA: TerC/Alx family metal homeostasis membrane protein [Ignavibacteriaceae bacterium]|nr:TerC/Alx family metal homeostasis membrane protein [Ignavibacteriaceae bacterium]
MYNELTFWIAFAIIAAIIIVIDLYVTDHRQGRIGLKKSIMWSGIWVSTALLFFVAIHFFLEKGPQRSLEFLTGYLIEYSLSVDNLFVFLMIFRVMGVSKENQPHILKWGILSAIVFRIIFILIGVGLLNLFQPIIYFFGLILLYGAYKMAFGGDKEINLEKHPIIKIIRRYFNILPDYKGKKFFTKKDSTVYATPIFLTFLLIESSDIVFAVDSIPAIIAITRDSFIIITSNIFAILGLRALYFALAGIVDLFIYLKYGVAIILFYVGVKMMISDVYHIPTEISLGIIVALLAGSIILSLVFKKDSKS